MRMISVPISLGLTGSTMFQRLMNGLMLIMVCPYILRVRVESFFFNEFFTSFFRWRCVCVNLYFFFEV